MIINEKLDKQVVESYKNGEALSVILSCFNIGKGTLYAILDENKVPRRQNKNYKKRLSVTPLRSDTNEREQVLPYVRQGGNH